MSASFSAAVSSTAANLSCEDQPSEPAVSIGQKLTLAARLRTPLVQYRRRNPCFLSQLQNGHIVRLQHPLQHSQICVTVEYPKSVSYRAHLKNREK